MKCLLANIVTLICCSACFAQEGMPQMPSPSKQHKELAKDVGEWEGEMRIWMDPNAEPMVVPISETNRMISGGLWLLSEFECGPYLGTGVFGYDTINNEHIGTWVENGHTHMSVMRGKINDEGSLVMHFRGFDAMTQQEKDMKSVTTRTGEETKSFVMYQKGDGDDWIKTFEIDYRKKS